MQKRGVAMDKVSYVELGVSNNNEILIGMAGVVFALVVFISIRGFMNPPRR